MQYQWQWLGWMQWGNTHMMVMVVEIGGGIIQLTGSINVRGRNALLEGA